MLTVADVEGISRSLSLLHLRPERPVKASEAENWERKTAQHLLLYEGEIDL